MKQYEQYSGIEGNRSRYPYGDIIDLAKALNLWIEENEDKMIIDVKVIRGNTCYSALISHKKTTFIKKGD